LVAVLVAVGFSDHRGAVAETAFFAVNSYGRFSLQRLPLPSQPFLCNLTSVGHTCSSHMGKKSGKPTDVSERKSSHVPGQYLGYALQPTRLLSLALDAAPGSSLSLEVFEDVGVEEGSGERLASQTKTARDSNPVSDRAIDLWKTFSNWLTAISKGELDPSKTCFEIYLAKQRTGKIVRSFNDAQTEAEAQKALKEAKEAFWPPDAKPAKKSTIPVELEPFVKHVLTSPNPSAVELIRRFRLTVAKTDPFKEIRAKVVSKWVRPESVDLVIQHAHGWIKEYLDGLIQTGQSAILRVDDFNGEMAKFIPRCDFKQILTVMAGRNMASDDELAAEQMRLYVRQLALIEYADEDVIEAINCYLRASAERTAWSKAGLVHEASFEEYEESLVKYWKNRTTVHEITGQQYPSVQRGQLLLADCSVHQQTLQGLEVPSFFTPGSYHALAEDRTVGWHPEYTSLLANGGADVGTK
jgi:hypothetical protein